MWNIIDVIDVIKNRKIKTYDLEDLEKLTDSIFDFCKENSPRESIYDGFSFRYRYKDEDYGLIVQSNGLSRDRTLILPPWKDSNSNNPAIMKNPYLEYNWTWGGGPATRVSYGGKWARHGIDDFAKIPQKFLDWFEEKLE